VISALLKGVAPHALQDILLIVKDYAFKAALLTNIGNIERMDARLALQHIPTVSNAMNQIMQMLPNHMLRY
jgi:hypothetical protein